MVALAMMPTLSRVWASTQGQGAWVEICTAQGMRWVSADEAGTSGPGTPAAPAAGDHCPYCSLAHTPVVPAAAVASVMTPPAGADALPALFLHAPRTLFAWASAQPRAPPSLS